MNIPRDFGPFGFQRCQLHRKHTLHTLDCLGHAFSLRNVNLRHRSGLVDFGDKRTALGFIVERFTLLLGTWADERVVERVL